MGIPNHDLSALEQRRLTLEDNILQLQQSLYHWRTWEAEYDGIREEIANLDSHASTEDFLAVGREFGGTLVDEEEMQKILGSQGVSRSRGQVVDLLGRRIDYVKQNVATMEKRLQSAENELHELDGQDQALPPGGADFPMREIMEELDEDGDVISSSINTPGDQAPQLLDVLKQVGVQNIPETAQPAQNIAAETSSAATEDKPEDKPAGSATSEEKHSPDCPVHAPEETDLVEVDNPDTERPISLVTPEDRQQPPVTNIDESAEDARLRREMFQYGIDEVGAIVAELEMDEEGSEFSLDEDDEDYAFNSDEEENEDEYGRSHTVLSEEYHQQMRELEAKLNARGMYNIGKNTESLPEEMRQEIENPPAVQEPHSNGVEPSENGKKQKKRVAFADDLDIAPAPEPAPVTAEKRRLPSKQPDVTVLSDAIVERTERALEAQPAVSDAPKKVSRFKSARAAAPANATANSSSAESSLKPSQSLETGSTRKQANAVPAATPPALFPATPQEPKPFSTPISDITETPSGPQPPEGKTLADKLVERDVVPGTAPAPELDELDEEMHRREIASEFYRVRNRMIQQQGGFVNDDETEYEIREGETEPKRISKFRAARMK